MTNLMTELVSLGIQPEPLSLAASLLAAVVPRFRSGPRAEAEHGSPALLEHGSTVFAICDASGVIREITANAKHVLGDACERAGEFHLTLPELLQPEQRAQAEQIVQRLPRTAAAESFTVELLTRAPSGAPRWLEINIRNLLSKSAVSGYFLEIRDITHRHSAEGASNLLSNALERLAESVMVTDATGLIEYVNPAFEAQTGYKSSEVVGRTPALLKSGKHAAEVYEQLWTTLRAGNVFRGELSNRRRNGDLYHQEIVITPIHDTDGATTHYVSSGRDITEQKRRESQSEDLAYYDELTGVCNPRLLRERAKQALPLARRHGHTSAMLQVDVAGLRSLKDRLGRPVGDEVLRRVAERLRQGLRESDTLARSGGDQFLVLLSEVAEEDATARVVRRLRDSICKPFKIQEQTITVDASIGVALYPQDATTFDELAEYAEMALTRARTTKSGVEFFRRELTELTNERLSLEDDLRWAWERKQFILHYQPIVAMDTGDVVGAEALARGHVVGMEALARWPHLERGLILPAQFIPLAERTGRIVALDRWAIATAARQAATWSQHGWPGWVSVNLSARSLHDPELSSYIASCMQQHKVEPGRIVLEITESAAMRDVETTARVLRELRETGVLIAIDDFGVGHSSLAYLKHFPVDILKLDSSFVQDIGLDPKFEHLIEVIITLAHRIGATIIAEGVEHQEQFDWLRAAGCDYVQGYLIGRPQPPEQVNPLERRGTSDE